MKFEEIEPLLHGVGYITKRNAKWIYDLILKQRATRILELGIAHGTASCYMAAALQELGEGSVTCVDLISAKEEFKPTAEEQLERTGLSGFSEVVRMQTGYNWFLHDEIRRNTRNGQCRPIYDVCIIDGPKNWTIDGAAFFMVDKLLKTNGWLIFDDYAWTYADAETKRDQTDGISHRTLSDEEKQIPHIREIVELLVQQHPSYGKLLLLDFDDWAVAQKTAADIKTVTIVRRNEYTSKNISKKVLYSLKHWLDRRS